MGCRDDTLRHSATRTAPHGTATDGIPSWCVAPRVCYIPALFGLPLLLDLFSCLSFSFFQCIWFAGVRTPVVSSTMTWHFTVYTPFTPLRCTRYLVAFLCRSFVITELASLLGSRTSTDTGKGVLDVEGYYRKKTA